ncbi:FAD-dependent oxidoreductase [Mucilaginibacter sp. BT774]|uniref:FAD-dependent oxidoreductase n=1 Tax=Mucilaginibacter sp. BT774 TaxID=3062276 RepID=UPI0026763628|nr:FAD-dependent oxidoreductase [Mucilaginibacter sp. BT774]MDO3626652.1 FAD-dependent oxidoreductase [Mucilaginibacter sp. BT774]
MIKKLLIPLLSLVFTFSRAETIKTDVLVIGGGASGIAAAIQSARSKVKTLLVEPGPWLGGSMTMGGMSVLEANRNLPSGIWGEFHRKVTDYYRPRLGYDTTHNSILRFEPYTGAEILKKICDTVKNLTVKMKTPWTSVKKDGTGWEVTIMVNGEAVKVDTKVLIDGTETGEVAAKAGAKFEGNTDTERIVCIAILKDFGRNADKTIAKPLEYDASAYSWLKAKDIKQMLRAGSIPNDKYMIDWDKYNNSNAGAITNKDELYKKAKLRTLGLVYYLQTELGYKNLGLDGQFGTPDNLPPVPLVLESRHVKGAVRMVMDDITKPYERESKLYRTTIAVSDAVPTGIQFDKFPSHTIPLGSIVVNDLDNVLVTEKALSVTDEVNNSTMCPSVQMTLGQGVGATAAFCAFFKTTTKHLHVRIIQGEILDYKGYLLPITDIAQKDPHWRAVQQVCATGLLKGVQKSNGNSIEIHFEPNDMVNTEEIKPVLLEIYTRAFLWFNKEKPGDKFTLGNLLSLISDYTLTDPKTLQLHLQKAWAPQFKLTGTFDLNRPITRLEFAVLTNKYLNPFAKTVDLSGRVIN